MPSKRFVVRVVSVLPAIAALVVLGASPASANGVGVRAHVHGAGQLVGVTAFSPNVTMGDDDVRDLAIGGGIDLMLPFLGLRVGGQAAIHRMEADLETVNAVGLGVLDVAGTLDADTTEFGASLESRVHFARWSIQDPTLGVGAAYVHLRTSGDLVTTRAARTRSDLDGSSHAIRVYGVLGFDLLPGFGVDLRGGYVFHDGLTVAAEELRATGTPAGVTFDREGAFAAVGLVARIR